VGGDTEGYIIKETLYIDFKLMVTCVVIQCE